MTTLVGLFFSAISILGLFKCRSKRSIKKMLLIAFSLSLVFFQVLFMNDMIAVTGQEFIGLSGVLSGIVLILSFQRNHVEEWR